MLFVSPEQIKHSSMQQKISSLRPDKKERDEMQAKGIKKEMTGRMDRGRYMRQGVIKVISMHNRMMHMIRLQ